MHAQPAHNNNQTHFRSYSSAAVSTGHAVTWSQQLADLQKMWMDDVPLDEIAAHLQRSASAVLTQAVRQGLPRRALPGRKPVKSAQAAPRLKCLAPPNVIQFRRASSEPTVQAKTEARRCLRCTTSFPSAGAHNRICPKCKDSNAYQNSSRLFDEHEFYSIGA